MHSESIPVISEEQGSEQVEGEQRSLVETSQNSGNSSNKESLQEPGSLSELNSDESNADSNSDESNSEKTNSGGASEDAENQLEIQESIDQGGETTEDQGQLPSARKWTRSHTLDQIIGDPEARVRTRASATNEFFQTG